MKNLVFKKIALSLLILINAFLIISCSKEQKTKLDTVYFANIYNFKECYIYDGTSAFPGFKMNIYQDNIYQAQTENNKNIIFSDGTTQLPEVKFNKQLPYYLNGWKEESRLIEKYHYVYFTLGHGFDNPLLCYNVGTETKQEKMIFLGNNLYLGLLSESINEYYYQDAKSNLQTNTLTYNDNLNHYRYNELVAYQENDQIIIDNNIPAETYRIYFIKPLDWTDCYIYFWNNNTDYQTWPGIPANYLGADVYYYDIPDSYPNFIFNCGPNTSNIIVSKTPDLQMTTSSYYEYPCYNLTNSSFEELFLVKGIKNSYKTVYIDKPSNWSDLYVISPIAKKAMTWVIDNLYSCEIPIDTKEIIFSNGLNNTLIPLAFESDKPYYHQGSWIVYEQKPDEDIVNPDKNQLVTYQELFDPNSNISIEIQISPEELLKIEKDYQKFSAMGSKSPTYRMCNLKITINYDVYYYPQVGIRMKGNTSRNNFYSEEKGIYNLIHLKLSFDETFDDVDQYTKNEIINWNIAERQLRKQRTFATLSSLDLKWNKNLDSTYLKSIYAGKFFQEAGILSAYSTLAGVKITQFDNLENLGVFQVIENIDNNFLEKHLAQKDLGGDLYKVGWDSSSGGTLALNTLSSIGIEDELNCYFPIYDLKTNKKTSKHELLKNLINSLSSDIAKLDSLVDMDYFTKFSAISYLVGNPDDFRNNYNNYYLYFLKSSNKAIFIPYDLDRVFGITKDWDPSGNAMTEIDPYSLNAIPGKQQNPIIVEMINNSKYSTKYTNYLKEYRDNSLFTTLSFTNLFNTYRNNYRTIVKPSITLNNSYVVFSLTDSINMTFDNYLNKIIRKLKEI